MNKREKLQKRIRTETITGEVCGKIAVYSTIVTIGAMMLGYAITLKADLDERKLRKLMSNNK